MQTVLGMSKPLTSTSVLLHDDGDFPVFKYQEYGWFATTLASAKMGILRLWRTGTTPTHHTWVEDMHKVATHERIIYKVNDQMDKFTAYWGTFMELSDLLGIENP